MLTILVLFEFFPGGSGVVSVSLGFDGVLPMGFYSLMPTWSSSGAPVVTEQIVWRASYAIYHQRGGGD